MYKFRVKKVIVVVELNKIIQDATEGEKYAQKCCTAELKKD